MFPSVSCYLSAYFLSFSLYNDCAGGGGGRGFSVYSNDSITLILIETLKAKGIQDFTFFFFLSMTLNKVSCQNFQKVPFSLVRTFNMKSNLWTDL